MKINPSSSTVMLGQGSELVHLNCSVHTNPLSRLKWTRIGANFTEPLEAYQPIVGFNETVFSILSVNVTKLGLGTHMFECRVDVTTFYYNLRMPIHHTTSANVTVSVWDPSTRSSSIPETNISITHSLESSAVDVHGKFCLGWCVITLYFCLVHWKIMCIAVSSMRTVICMQ